MNDGLLSTWARPTMIGLVAFSLLLGIAGGLMRAGVPVIGWLPAAWVLPAASLHAALMVCGFLGTVIGIERAVALHAPWAFLAPLFSGSGAVCLMLGQAWLGMALMVLAGAAFVLVNLFIVGKQSARHTWLLLVSALVWLLGNVRLMHHGLANGTLLAWLGFLILTIAAERLEMTRLMRVRPWSNPLLLGCLAMLLSGIALAEWQDQAALLAWGFGLITLSAWLITFDMARMLHASVLMRLLAGHDDATWLARGSTLNAAAIAVFAMTVLSAAWSWRRRHP
ncbi:MAG: hypothetical protein HYX44_12070 [Aquabacterium sp.]|nr:hypothetical protein [Aquabacterium sp.]